jgi:predicted ABC-type ATPase
MWLIAGPNGSGKSTAVDYGLLEKITGASFQKLNADIKTRQLLIDDPKLEISRANYLAAKLIDAEVDTLIFAGVSFAVETVLSTDKYKPKVEEWKRRGHNLGLVFVTLATPEDNVDRVRLRVQTGGHDVPPEKIRARWNRSLANLPWFAERADIVFVFDNTAPGSTSDSPVLLALKLLNGKLRLSRPGYHLRVDAELTPLVGDNY